MEVVDLGLHPLADLFVSGNSLSSVPYHPLVLDYCSKCGQVQSRYLTLVEDRYNDVMNPYSYTSSNSASSRKYWDSFAIEAIKKYGLSSKTSVLEIGSNDGYLTAQFVSRGIPSVGVDASNSMVRRAKDNYPEIPFFADLFGTTSLMELQNGPVRQSIMRQKMGLMKPLAFDFICANNVVNHVEDLTDFMLAIRYALKPDGVFVFEVPYWKVNINKFEFDTIYHEHVSYFTATSVTNAVQKAGLRLVDAEETPYHGGTLKATVVQTNSKHKATSAMYRVLSNEQKGMFDPRVIAEYARQVKLRKISFLEQFYDRRELGIPAVAIGAAAKGNTILNYYKLDRSVVSYVTDSSPLKINKYTPGSAIPIVDDAFAMKEFKGKEVDAIILARNLPVSLQDALRKMNPKVQFVLP